MTPMPLPISQSRAKEILKSEANGPFGAEVYSFMTSEEIDAVRRYWLATDNGRSSFSSTICKIAKGPKP